MQGPNDMPIIGSKKQEPIKIMVGIPYYRDISVRTMSALLQTMGSIPYQFVNMWHGTANLVEGRNVISKAFMESDCQYLWFLDSDMVFDPRQVLMMLSALDEHKDAGLIAGMYTKRDGSMTPLVGLLDDKGNPPAIDTHIDWLLEHRGQVVDASLMPTGFMFIRREAFEKLEPPYFYRDWPWRTNDEAHPSMKDKMMSSDNVFVRDVREVAGMKTLAHLGVELGHLGEVVYLPEHFYQQADSFRVGSQIQRVKDNLGTEHGYDSPAYWDGLYHAELSAGRKRDYVELHEAVRAAVVGKQKVLDMGAGPGVLAEKLAEDGHDVTVSDFSEVAVKYCQQLGFEGFQFDLENDSLKPGQHKSYDVVVATEVLEHLEDPQKAIKKMYSFLKPGGLLIVTTPNNCLPPEEEPEHKQVVTEAGLRTWLAAFEDMDVLKINTQPFPKLMGLGKKPE